MKVQMNPIPAGEVVLSDRRTETKWKVEVKPFALATTPITQAQYAAAVGQNPSAMPGDDHPVETVSWWDALRFCNALSQQEGLTPVYHFQKEERIDWNTGASGYRLPTEAEWEFACRAGTEGPRYAALNDISWYSENSQGTSHPVAQKAPNQFGLFDMLGNVWEWCWDIYDAEVYKTYRVLRGGGWADEHWSCRASVRRRSHPTFRIEDVGFRVARSLPFASVETS